MKTAIIIPGWQEETSKHHEEIAQLFHERGYEQVVIHTPNWKKASMKYFVSDFLNTISSDGDAHTLFGFSMGAMIALVVSCTVQVDNLILCSPSGYFKEYMSLFSEEDFAWTAKNLPDFSAYSSADILDSLRVNNGYIIAGEKELAEWPDFRQWITDLREKTSWQYSEVTTVGHDIAHVDYMRQIAQVIRSI